MQSLSLTCILPILSSHGKVPLNVKNPNLYPLCVDELFIKGS